jgi:hypothetical protein
MKMQIFSAFTLCKALQNKKIKHSVSLKGMCQYVRAKFTNDGAKQ